MENLGLESYCISGARTFKKAQIEAVLMDALASFLKEDGPV